MQHKKPILGCIADDFTGASDLASFLVASGAKTLQVNTLKHLDNVQIEQYDVVVVALKTRTIDSEAAIDMSLMALEWLQKIGCRKFYFKYCSTFDSTKSGNIGPVIDALLHALNQSSTIICPALPVNGRTVYQGYLFVDDKLLNESSLKDHPLTPMQDASLIRLIEAQGQGKATHIPLSVIDGDEALLNTQLITAANDFRYVILDAVSTENLLSIGRVLDPFTLITGGSGLATDLTPFLSAYGFVPQPEDIGHIKLNGGTLLLSGSCSAMTQAQVEVYRQEHPSFYVDPLKLSRGELQYQHILDWLEIYSDDSPLIYTTAPKDKVINSQQVIGFEESQTLLENTLAQLSVDAVKLGYQNIIVAGGETSGAVVKALNIKAFKVGQSVAPGVPIMQSVSVPRVNLILKSGNFGAETFFQTAKETLACY